MDLPELTQEFIDSCVHNFKRENTFMGFGFGPRKAYIPKSYLMAKLDLLLDPTGKIITERDIYGEPDKEYVLGLLNAYGKPIPTHFINPEKMNKLLEKSGRQNPPLVPLVLTRDFPISHQGAYQIGATMDIVM